LNNSTIIVKPFHDQSFVKSKSLLYSQVFPIVMDDYWNLACAYITSVMSFLVSYCCRQQIQPTLQSSACWWNESTQEHIMEMIKSHTSTFRGITYHLNVPEH